MHVNTTNNTFTLGLDSLKANNFQEAFEAFRTAHKEDPLNPHHLSYYGLTLALGEGNFDQGILLCRQAIHLTPFEPQFYVNLSRAYMKAGRRKQALETLREGLALNLKGKLLKSELARIDARRKPFFPRLSRNNFLNRVIGKLTYQFHKKSTPHQSTP